MERVKLLEQTMTKVYVAGHRGMVGGAILRQLQARQTAGEPLELPLTGLTPDSEYVYTLSFLNRGAVWETEPIRSFRTQRK